MFKTTTALFILIGGALASSHTYVIHERRGAPPPAWSSSVRANTSSVVPLRIGLAQSNLDHMEELLMDVSHPSSSNYGKHWAPEQVAMTFAPSRETIQAVGTWLEESGIDRQRIRLSAGRNWMDVKDATLKEIEDLFKAEYHVFIHERTGEKHISCQSYSIPQHLQRHIEVITPSTSFDMRRTAPKPPVVRERQRSIDTPTPGANRKLGQPGLNSPKSGGTLDDSTVSSIVGNLANCSNAITLDCLRALYDFEYDPVVPEKNSYGIVEYTPQAYVPSDLDIFFEKFDPSLVGSRPNLVSIDGGVVQQVNKSFDYNGESDLDLQYAMSLVAPTNITLLQTGDLIEGASFNNLLDALDGSYCTYLGGDDPTQDGIYPDPYGDGYEGPENCGTVKPPYVISTSYASDEADATPFYDTRQCNEYAKLGLMGTTFLFSSGDEGVAGNSENCLTPSGQQVPNGTLFNPLFPASCPYVTAVGATQVSPGRTVYEPESACEEIIYSGGGFSNVFARPSYQSSAVSSYLKNHFPSYIAGRFNNTGTRGFPDIAANGANYVVAVDGMFELVYGTSCSSPVVGSMITSINDARIAVGKAPVGFINPVLYENPQAFNDITNGTNPGCGTVGFTAVEGWDPVTGLGTPNFAKLLAVWLALP